MRIIKIIFFFILVIMFSSCTDESTVVVENQYFFDLKTFFKQEQEQSKNIKKIIKKATIDGFVEEKTMDSFDLEKELALFIDSDINKVAWLDKYTVDSLFNNNLLTRITYIAKEEELKTDLLTIHFDKGLVDSIDIIRKTSSLAAKLEQHLKYIPTKGYSIESLQKTSISAAHVLELDVQFVY
jgi:uncharacterized protein YxeA